MASWPRGILRPNSNNPTSSTLLTFCLSLPSVRPPSRHCRYSWRIHIFCRLIATAAARRLWDTQSATRPARIPTESPHCRPKHGSRLSASSRRPLSPSSFAEASRILRVSTSYDSHLTHRPPKGPRLRPVEFLPPLSIKPWAISELRMPKLPGPHIQTHNHPRMKSLS